MVYGKKKIYWASFCGYSHFSDHYRIYRVLPDTFCFKKKVSGSTRYIYIVCFLILFVSKKKIQVYEVTTGNVGKTLSGTGVILRDESVYNVADTGNISYYQREGTRVKVETPIYTIDKTGKLDQLIKEYASNEGGLTSEEKKGDTFASDTLQV